MSRYITEWDVENAQFWEQKGRKTAVRNLLISIPAMLLAFAVWMMWSIVTTKMKEFGFNFGLTNPSMSPEELTETLKKVNSLYYTLPAIAGLSGATLRIPNSFLIALSGGRNVIFTVTSLLLIPCAGIGFALRDVNTPYYVFAVLAALSGLGGGSFASSMSNISFFFPKRMQGTSLGLNAGIGNLGVGVMQKAVPWVTGIALFSAFDSTGAVTNSAISGVQNAGWLWVIPIALLALAAFFGMNNLRIATPGMPSTLAGVAKTLYLLGIGLTSTGIGAYLLIGLGLNMWAVLPLVVIMTLLLMRYATPKEIKGGLSKQFAILRLKHNWIMTVLYTMTFGSFIGFSAAFPKLCQDIFVYTNPSDPGFMNPNAPDFLFWVFLGPVLGAGVRPLGGWLADKVNSGAKITAVSTVLQICATLAVAYFIKAAKNSPTPEDYWWPFFIMFMALFITTGIGNGSTFRSIPYIFSREHAGPVLGWTSAIAAYGAFLIPGIFGQQIAAGTPENALYGFAVFYVVCLFINWWNYQRPGAEIKNP
ncbi:NarK/NasA family nitrate transporter [Seleniivibrio woodruffii]|uniref:NarK/NasA family nitrate transporter n=1 Tax=Seleniivibrio woodruffii TaxID=1078050 RepID=UPI0039E479E7